MTKKHIAILAGVTSSFVLGVAAIFLASPSPAGSLAVSDTASGSTDVSLPVQAQVALDDDAFVTIPGGTYTVGCDQDGTECHEIQVESFRISTLDSNMLLDDECVKENIKIFAQLNYIDQAAPPHSPSQWMWSEYLSCLSDKNSTALSLPTANQILASVAFKKSIFEQVGVSHRSFLTQTCRPVDKADELYELTCTSVSCKQCEVVRVFSGHTSVIYKQDDDLRAFGQALIVKGGVK